MWTQVESQSDEDDKSYRNTQEYLSYQNVLKYYGECSNILAMLIYQFSLNELQEHLKPVFACY